MSHHQRGLILRALLALLGFVLALESFILKPHIRFNLSFDSSQSTNYDSGWSNDYQDNDYDSGGGWDFGGGGDSSWDSGGGWDSGDSGSWSDSGGDSGGW